MAWNSSNSGAQQQQQQGFMFDFGDPPTPSRMPPPPETPPSTALNPFAPGGNVNIINRQYSEMEGGGVGGEGTTTGSGDLPPPKVAAAGGMGQKQSSSLVSYPGSIEGLPKPGAKTTAASSSAPYASGQSPPTSNLIDPNSLMVGGNLGSADRTVRSRPVSRGQVVVELQRQLSTGGGGNGSFNGQPSSSSLLFSPEGGTDDAEENAAATSTTNTSNNPLDTLGSPNHAMLPSTPNSDEAAASILSLKSLDIPTAVEEFNANKKLSENMNEVLMRIKAPDGGMMVRHRVPPHITSLEGGEMDSETGKMKKPTEGRDIVQGSYLGGLKIWSCAPHLCEFLVHCVHGVAGSTTSAAGGDPAAQNEILKHGFLRQTLTDCLRGPVLELGCGHGLPGITALRLGAEDVTFLDFNQEVIEEVTIPNIALNARADEQDRERFGMTVVSSGSFASPTSTTSGGSANSRTGGGKKQKQSSSPSSSSAGNKFSVSHCVTSTKRSKDSEPIQVRPPMRLNKYDINPEAIIRTCSGDWSHFAPSRFFVRTWSEIEGRSARSLPPSAQFDCIVSSPTSKHLKSAPIQLPGNLGTGLRQFSELSLEGGFGNEEHTGQKNVNNGPPQLFSLILGTDVTYDDAVTFSVLSAISRLLEPRTGVALLSTKPFYFGTGGGWAKVQDIIRKWNISLNGMTATVVEHTKGGGGMERMIIMLQVGH